MRTKMEKIQANMCFDVVFLYENIRTCFYTFSCISPFNAHFYTHYFVKGLLVKTYSLVCEIERTALLLFLAVTGFP